MIIEFVSLMWYNEKQYTEVVIMSKKIKLFNFKVLLTTFSLFDF